MNIKKLFRSNIWLLVSVGMYMLVAVLSINNYFFWDNIQQTSIEAHWFYLTDFKSLIIQPNIIDGISATGYHPPLMGLLTAVLWNVFGYHLWVSHALVGLWAIALFYNVLKLVAHFIDEKYLGFVGAIILLEATVLSQYAIASPDFILLTAFVMSVRAIIERKNGLLAVGVFFLCTINMRGVFAGVVLFAANNYYNYLTSGKKFSFSLFFQTLKPYVPTLLVLLSYYTLYFATNGWFIDNAQSAHYALPTSVGVVMKHIAEFAVRALENGRFLVWFIGIYAVYQIFKTKELRNNEISFITVTLLLLTGLYVLFIFITQMPFGPRYLMPIFVLLTIVATYVITKSRSARATWIILSLILFLELTGHFWVYPDKIAKPWDATLAHFPFYELRDECFDYLENENIDFDDVSAGFCLYGNQRYITLRDKNQVVSPIVDGRHYFIHSNISNNEDDFVNELRNTSEWTPVKTFSKGFVYITLYKRALENEN